MEEHTCPRCKEMHRRAQKAESKAAHVFAKHAHALSEAASNFQNASTTASRLSRLYRSEWRQFQTDDPMFLNMYGKYLNNSKFLQLLKNFFKSGK